MIEMNLNCNKLSLICVPSKASETVHLNKCVAISAAERFLLLSLHKSSIKKFLNDSIIILNLKRKTGY